jgi:hypothetical protein
MDKYIKIAFAGEMGSGKDTAVDYIISKYGGIKISFAKPIYDILKFAQNITGIKKEKDRKFLQFIGDEWGRDKDMNIWIDILSRNTQNIYSHIYINDLRYKNEYDYLRENGWIIIKIFRDNYDKNNYVGTGLIDHDSEKLVNELNDSYWDDVILNIGSVEDFYRQLDVKISKYYI